MEIKVGQTIGDYEIVGTLGKGGMGTVFSVRNLLSDRIEAMKVVLPDLTANSEACDRFLREIRVHASLDHPNIAALRTALRVGDRVLMIMELVQGVSLQERLAKGPVDAEEAVACIDQVLSALALAHSRGVIHRDIKPANILVTPQGVIKLTDFGIARASGDSTLTKNGVALGSIFYMSPEQVRARPVDPRSDLYSVGVTFYEMITGSRPIEGESEHAIMEAHLKKIPVPPCLWRPSISAALSDIVMKSLAKLPEDRFQSAAEFRDALRRLDTFSFPSTGVSVPPPAALTRTMLQETAGAPPPASLTTAQIAAVESALARPLGPIARHLVTQAVRECTTLPQLCERLATHIDDPQERTSFLRRATGGATSGEHAANPDHRTTHSPAAYPPSTHQPVAVNTPAPSTPVWDPATLAAIKRALSGYLGPIAGVLVDRTSKSAQSTHDLCHKLAAQIDSERDRKAFLQSVARLS